MPGPDLTFQVVGVSKAYGGRPALTDVSFTIHSGEVLGLIGPNGAGKTTLFEGLAGTLPLDAGELVWQGRPLTGAERHVHVGYVPDGIAPWGAERLDWILDYVVGFFGGRGLAPAQLIDELDLKRCLDVPLDALSKGQRKRAVLAVALLLPQPLLLIDEPFDGLDLRQTRHVGELLRNHASAGRTLFLSIHQIGDAARICDRLILLNGGRVVGEGTVEELTQASGPSPNRVTALEDIFLALT